MTAPYDMKAGGQMVGDGLSTTEGGSDIRRQLGRSPVTAKTLSAAGRTVLVLLLGAASAAAADWEAEERIVHYSVPGTSGAALYAAIGKSGPEPIPGRRAIAHTTWDLKWRRDYRPEGGGCRLASALPFLKITYTLPKPSSELSAATARSWQKFYDGMARHEEIHGELLRDMTDQIIADTVGLSTRNDPDCTKIRELVLERVAAAFKNYNKQSAAFDRVEMRGGGNVHQLIIDLISGR